MKKIESISSAALLLAFSIFLSRVLGYVREMLLAWKFGASATTDAFYAAFQIPDLLNYFLAGGALSIAFIPLYNKTLASEGEAAAHKLMANIFGTLGALAVLLTGLLWWKAPALIAMQFPNYDADTMALTVHLTRIVLPAQVFFITGGIIQAVQLAHRSFQSAALAPLVYNICIICGGYFLYPYCGIEGFAIGTLAGAGLGPFLMPVIYSRKHIPIRMRFAPQEKDFRVYLGLAAPLMFGQTLLTLDEWYGRWFGALLAAGSVAHIAYARRLMQVPIAVIGQAIGAAALPTLSHLWAEGRKDEFDGVLKETLRTGIALAVLAGGAFFALAYPAVSFIYQHGAFSAADAATVGTLTALFAFAIPAWITQQIAVRAFYARGDTLRPMVFCTVLSLLALPLYMMMGKTFGVTGLALAGVTAMSINGLATVLYARHLHGAPALLPLGKSFLKALAVAAPAAVAARGAIWLRSAMAPELFANIDGLWLALADICIGGLIYALIALPAIGLWGDDGVRAFMQKLLRKIIRTSKNGTE